MDKKLVLVVDDDINMLKIIRLYLQDDYNVAIVNSGKSALDFVIKRTPDLILLDYMMPLFDGPTVLEIMRKRAETKNTPVIFLTSVTEKDKIVHCLTFNPKGYVIKPVTRNELLSRVKDVIG